MKPDVYATYTAEVAEVRRGSAVGDVFRKAGKAIGTWNKRRTAIQELSALSDRQLADIGLLRGDIPSIVNDLVK
jgi:uncharacterized protein YjiS (DUF1127 family)